MSPGFGKRSQVTKNVGGERSPEPQSLYARRAHPTATLQPRRHAPLRPPPRSRRPGRDLATLQPRRLTPPHALIATATLQPRRHAPLRPPPRSRRPGRDLASSPAAARTHLAAAHDPHRHRAPTLATHPTADPRHDDLASSPAAARTHLAAAHDPHRHRAPAPVLPSNTTLERLEEAAPERSSPLITNQQAKNASYFFRATARLLLWLLPVEGLKLNFTFVWSFPPFF